jgi:hypothetical protein
VQPRLGGRAEHLIWQRSPVSVYGHELLDT